MSLSDARYRLPLFLILTSTLVMGCASTSKPNASEGQSATSTSPPAGWQSATRPLGSERPGALRPWEDPSSPLYERTIYFDYDTAQIKPEYVNLIRSHARYLGDHPDLRVTLEGHTDERGTREYNLALGDRRAEAVHQFMLSEGVRPKQLATLSYGEERPSDPGHTEQSWRLNRRVFIQYY
ncbi:peptidoglycan-associated lipoprotein Pal [Caldichromatium japonicum]|uniref:Peptidoglycan-associated lipoprotein n=1 Tax=Caldichromatium japonicum TaxID=2699430 RepID=A0A6G7VBW0_9GAMM|nr:peptidoglycan-associated lipoprotein Pal [Caldichromatium japonicum]QIK37563.1 peptidoglycan-associated lipoprotein Pal [Caldichromatium japonicum]